MSMTHPLQLKVQICEGVSRSVRGLLNTNAYTCDGIEYRTG